MKYIVKFYIKILKINQFKSLRFELIVNEF
jgi:hypothetical protein